MKELLAHGAAIEAMKEKENQLKNKSVDDRNKQGKPILENKSTTEETSKKRSQALNVVTDKKFEVNKKLKTEKDDINKSKQIKVCALSWKSKVFIDFILMFVKQSDHFFKKHQTDYFS